MTNLDIIKYLAYENPSRLAELLDDIYCIAWNNGSYAGSNGEGKLLEECEIDDFNDWLHEDPAKCGMYYDEELAEWAKPIDYPIIEITYPDNLVVELPTEGKDPNHMWNTDNNNNVNSDAIDEIKLLETILETDKYSDSLYDSFRKEVCADCPSTECIQSKTDIVECPVFDNYLFDI